MDKGRDVRGFVRGWYAVGAWLACWGGQVIDLIGQFANPMALWRRLYINSMTHGLGAISLTIGIGLKNFDAIDDLGIAMELE